MLLGHVSNIYGIFCNIQITCLIPNYRGIKLLNLNLTIYCRIVYVRVFFARLLRPLVSYALQCFSSVLSKIVVWLSVFIIVNIILKKWRSGLISFDTELTTYDIIHFVSRKCEPRRARPHNAFKSTPSPVILGLFSRIETLGLRHSNR